VGEGNARGDVHLPEDVVKVSLDRLLAEEQFCGDLGIRLAINDETRQLELTFSQRLDAGSVALAWPSATVIPLAKLPELALGFVAVTQRAAGVEFYGCMPQFGDRAVALAGLRERATPERP
jgi:hypothetical protein